MAGKATKPILDTKTGKEYPSMYSAGKELGKKLVPSYTGADRLIWFAMTRAFPDRFQTKNSAGEWVALNDPSVPVVKRARKTETDDQKRSRLLAELGEIDARKAASGEGTTAATPAKAAKKPAAAVAAAAEDEETGEIEEVEETTVVTPGKGKKLAGAMAKA